MDLGTRTLAGRYRLEAVIGRGGMSKVYRATDVVLGRTVAIKVLLAELADEDATYVERFQREARAAAALANSSVVTVYDTGVDDDGARFIAMEYVTGRSLAAILGDGSPLPVDEAVRVAERVAAALAAAHAAGILHRDIKPANVMIADDGTVKVLDFGIARKLDSTTLTQVASVIGTAAYMSPERALGNAGDARSDVYSLGCLLYAMLTGSAPFGGEVAAVILHQQINTEPRPPSERAAVPTALDLLVLSMLAKAPEDRPQTAAEVRDRLVALSGAGARRLVAPVAAAPPVPMAPTARFERTTATRLLAAPARWDHRRRAVVMAIATGALALAAIAIGSAGGSSRHPGSTAGQRVPSTAAARTQTSTAATRPAATTITTSQPPAAAAPASQNGGPPGHGGEPPGKAKKHDGGGGGD
jgi:serine/threonine-protein kinase